MTDSPEYERTALKEWAVLVDAMARGDIIAMVRKGGIREQRAGFNVRHDRFVFYPTYFHEKAHELAPRFRQGLAPAEQTRPDEGTIRIAHVADVVGLWTVTELERLRAIEAEHGLAWSAVESRFHYRDNPVVQVVAVRVSTLREPVVVPELRRYQGCVSWVALEDPVAIEGSAPVLSAEIIEKRLETLERALGVRERAPA
ncbi:MAG TPA: DUF1802 family protein [Gemmatimonadaceae bacterium]